MRPPRRLFVSIHRGILAVSFFACAGSSTLAQAPAQLPHAWNEAVYALAEKITAGLGSAHTLSLDLKDISATAPVDLEVVRRTLDDQFVQRGARPSPPPADAQVQVTVSQSASGYVLVGETRRGEAQQVVVVPVAAVAALEPQPAPEPGIQRKIVWQQALPILDFAQIAADAHRELLYFLEPDRLVAYEIDDGAQVLNVARPISKRYSSRDPRGLLFAADATHVSAFIGGVRCQTSWSPSFSVECHDNTGQQWPMGPVTWTYEPTRNYFSGAVTFASSLQAKFPAFFSSASPPPETSGQSSSRRVISGLDGQSDLFVGIAEPIATANNWGSEMASVASGCSSAWQVLVTGAGDWTQADQLQLYEIRDLRAVAVGQPMQLPGPVLAMWPADDGKSARMVLRNIESGLYEASIVSVACGN